MATVEIKLSVGVRWWLKYCLAGLLIVGRVTGRCPSDALIHRLVSRAVVVKGSR